MKQRPRVAVAALAAAALVVTGCDAPGEHAVPATHHTSARPDPAAALVVPETPSRTMDPTAAARPVPPNHCAHNHAARLVLVSIPTQHAWLCARHHTVLSTAVTTGASHVKFDATPRGRFRIQGLNRNTVLYPADGGAFPVKYWIPFDAPLYGFHDASWQKMPFGNPHYVTRGSHGCIHMPLRAIRFLFHWAHIGTRVLIR